MQTQKYAVGYKNITANDNFFTGHFPERKIMPGDADICCSHSPIMMYTSVSQSLVQTCELPQGLLESGRIPMCTLQKRTACGKPWRHSKPCCGGPLPHQDESHVQKVLWLDRPRLLSAAVLDIEASIC